MKILRLYFVLPFFLFSFVYGAIKPPYPFNDEKIVVFGPEEGGSDFFSETRSKITKEEGYTALQSTLDFLKKSRSNPDLTKYQKNEIRNILKNIDNYNVQILGFVRDNKKIIYLNFFPSTDNFSYWREHFVFVFDGGYYFWQIEYDIEEKKCISFNSNGYA